MLENAIFKNNFDERTTDGFNTFICFGKIFAAIFYVHGGIRSGIDKAVL